MDKKIMLATVGIITFMIVLFSWINLNSKEELPKTKKLSATILANKNNQLTLQDKNNIIYTFDTCNDDLKIGDNLLLTYTGLLNKNIELQNVQVTGCNIISAMKEENGIPSDWQDNGIFSTYYNLAYQKVKQLSLDEKIAQLLLIRYPDNNQIELLKKYQFGGYLFFEKDFRGKTKEQVKTMMSNLQSVSKIPILTAVDEEGGTVVRISSNPNLRDTPFASPSTLYSSGGFEKIKEDTIAKSTLLKELGLNLNLAPVVDVTTDPSAYMYKRTLGQGTGLTSTYAKTVIQASKGSGVSYTLKHFPGYGNNADTHPGSATDTRTYDDILDNDLPPFEAGINAGAEAIIVSHNIVTSIDPDNPASLSPSIHNLLRNQLNFTGIIITDDLSMGAVSNINNLPIEALLAGNDLLISTNYLEDMTTIKQAINNGTISENTINKLATRIIAWKYYKSLLFENQK